jgi:hypothetical protein
MKRASRKEIEANIRPILDQLFIEARYPSHPLEVYRLTAMLEFALVKFGLISKPFREAP